MRWTILTLFPTAFDSVLSASLFGKARVKGLIEVVVKDIRDFAEGCHRVVDDAPFGGGPGMVMKPEPLARAIDVLRAEDGNVHVILLSPRGNLLDQRRVRELSEVKHVALVCGRYEGVDERVRPLVDEELSIGNYVLAGGEAAAWVVTDAVSRLVTGVMGRAESAEEESFASASLLEYPHYTRPRVFRGMEVPEVLLSGDHQAIARWRRRQALLKTIHNRPDLLESISISEEERAGLENEDLKLPCP